MDDLIPEEGHSSFVRLNTHSCKHDSSILSAMAELYLKYKKTGKPR